MYRFRGPEPPFLLDTQAMDDWIDYYDSTHTIYASKLHRDLHFEVIARDIVGYISSPDAVVLDYACGEALSAAKVADACGKLYLAEPEIGRASCRERVWSSVDAVSVDERE